MISPCCKQCYAELPNHLPECAYYISPTTDAINAPSHYRQGQIEVIEVTETLDFCRGNVVKYVLRSEHKGAEIEDLHKARWYLQRLIERLEREIGAKA